MDVKEQMKTFFDAKAPTWDQICIHDHNKVNAIVTIAQVKEKTKVLDIACGTGVLFPELLDRNPSEITGIDLSEKMIAIARQKFSDARLSLYAQDFLTFPETGFDIAILYSAYPHFLEKEPLVQKVWHCLAPYGRFLVAHSESRDTINKRHQGHAVQSLSIGLEPVQEEVKLWEPYFKIDAYADTNDLYFFSGTKLE